MSEKRPRTNAKRCKEHLVTERPERRKTRRISALETSARGDDRTSVSSRNTIVSNNRGTGCKESMREPEDTTDYHGTIVATIVMRTCVGFDEYKNIAMTCKNLYRVATTTINGVHAATMEANRAMTSVFKDLRNTMLTGGAGSGKSHTLRRISAECQRRGWNYAICSTTAMSALQFDNAVTVHKWAGLGIRRYSHEQLDRILETGKRRLGRSDSFANTDVLIIDEVSMLPAHVLDLIEWIYEHFHGYRSPFAGRANWLTCYGRPERAIVIMCGDFYQLRPVGSSFVFKSESWSALRLVPVQLTTCVRQKDDLSYARLLNRVRTGTMSPHDMAKLQSRMLPADSPLRDPSRMDPEGRMLSAETLFPIHLAPTHQLTSAINDKFFEWNRNPVNLSVVAIDDYAQMIRDPFTDNVQWVTLTGEIANQVAASDEGRKTLERMEHLTPTVIRIKEGCQYIVTRNICEGVVNGTRCKFLEGQFVAPEVARQDVRCAWRPLHSLFKRIPRIMRIQGTNIHLRRMQIPLRLGYAVTIHASQGMTLKEGILDISKTFSTGLQYVALSRIETMSGVHLLNFNSKPIAVSAEVKKFYADTFPVSSHLALQP